MTQDESALVRGVGEVLNGIPTDTVLSVLTNLMAAAIGYGASDIQEADELIGSIDTRLKTLVRQNWDTLRQARFDVTSGGRA
ncbi:MAG: hypothetical protein WDN69_20290 [Aliidongia sp.]